MTISALVPTYRRPADLERCLEALRLQRRLADEVVVVARENDSATLACLERVDAAAIRLRRVVVTEPGVVHALNAGLATCSNDIVAITDDDAAPFPDWIDGIIRHFERRPDLGGVGGRDLLYVNDVLQTGRARTVGKLFALGKHVGNHHLGFGEPREVNVLKGVNGAYRTGALKEIGFDTRLRGSGAQVHWELALALALQRHGWKLLYDPAIAVNHYTAPRFDEDQREVFSPVAQSNMSYNEAFVRLDHLAWFARPLFLLWSVAIGTRATPGVVQFFRFLPSERQLAFRKFIASVRGRFDAWRDVAALPRTQR